VRAEWWIDNTTKDRHFRIMFSEYDIIAALSNMDSIDKYCLSEYERGGSVEELLMALQLLARKLDKGVAA
jgi:hypothetical protein